MSGIKEIILSSLSKMLRPIVRVLLKYQVSFGEVSNLLRRIFVEIAYHEFKQTNGKSTYAYTATITGIDRKMIQEILNTPLENEPKKPINKGLSVIKVWTTSKKYLDTRKKPKVLPIKGSTSFESLVQSACSDIPPSSILNELERVGVVKQLKDNKIKLIKEAYVPSNDEVNLLNVLFICANDLLITGEHNLNCPEDQKWFQREVQFSDIPISAVEKYKVLSEQKSRELLNELTRWLNENKMIAKENSAEPTKRVGLGIYYIETNNNREQG